VLLCYASLLIFLGIGVTVSRGGWAVTVVTLAVLFVWLIRQRDFSAARPAPAGRAGEHYGRFFRESRNSRKAGKTG